MRVCSEKGLVCSEKRVKDLEEINKKTDAGHWKLKLRKQIGKIRKGESIFR